MENRRCYYNTLIFHYFYAATCAEAKNFMDEQEAWIQIEFSLEDAEPAMDPNSELFTQAMMMLFEPITIWVYCDFANDEMLLRKWIFNYKIVTI